MKKNKTKNPLIKRVPRELKGDWSKYLLVSLFMIFCYRVYFRYVCGK